MSNFKSTRRALVTSIISMLLCFVMLLGTTFAWFTDSVTSSGNVIKSGTLDVEMYWAAGTEDPDAASWTDASKGAIFDYDRWEPGYTVARHLKIENKGTLALNYKLAIIPHGEVSKLADVIDVYYIPGSLQVDRDTDLSAYNKGTLRDLINTGIAAGSLKEMGNAADTYDATIVLKMRDEAGNEYQGLSIGSDFSIQLLATQESYEEDSFDETYDENAFFVVSTVDEFKAAVAKAIDTTTIFVQPGTYVFTDDTYVIQGKSINVVGLGVVNFKKADNANRHMFTIQEANDPEADTVVTFKNINFDGNGANNTRGNILMVKYNVTLNLENVTMKNAASSDICMDNGNPLNDGKFYNGVTTTVNLKNSDVEKVSMDTIPVVPSHVYYPDVPDGYKTYAYLWFDADSSVGIIEKQAISADASTMYINGDNSDTTGFYFYANDDASLKAVLDTIHTESKYWGKKVTVKLAAGEYSGDYVINQYPQWNGINGSGSGNNYASGVTNAPTLDITIVGTAKTTFSRGMTVTPATVFTGSFTVNGFGNSNTGFATANENPAYVNLKTVAFDGKDLPTGGDVIVFQALNAVDNLNFDGCYFANATHVLIGGTGNNPHIADDVAFNNCSFENGCLISGRAITLNVKNCTAKNAYYGFINSQNAATINVENCEVECSEYFLRTNNSGVVLNVTNTKITQTDTAAPKGTGLVVYRGSGHKATFTDCDVTYGTLKGNTGTGEIYFVTNEGGITLVEDALNNTTTLGKVSPETTGTFTVPADVDALGNGAFAGSGVTTVEIPASVKDFGASGVSATGASGGAFKDSAVEKVVLPDGMTEIPAAAFNGAKQLKEVNIPASVETIGVNAFRSTALTTLTIPATVKSIAVGAFRDMDSLETVIVEGDIYLPQFTFRNCDNLRTVYLNGSNVTMSTNTVFCNADTNNPGNSNITFYVKNSVVEARVRAAMGADNQNLTINVENPNTDNSIYVSNSAELLAALKNLKAGETTIHLLSGTYADDLDITVANLGKAEDKGVTGIKLVAADGAEVVFAGTTTLGLYVKGTTNVACYNANITFDGITFDHAQAGKHSIDVQNIASLYVVNCTINGDGEYGVGSASGNPIANECKFEKCDFENAGMQLYGNFSSNIVVDNCEFVESVVNVGAGGNDGPEIKNSKFTITLTDAHKANSFYVVRSSSTGANTTVTNCDIAVDSTVTGVGEAGAKGWGVFVTIGSYSITAENVRITMTDAALAQPALQIASIKSGVAGKINMTNVTLNGKSFVSNSDELVEAINNAADGDEINLLAGTYEVRFTNDTTFNVDNLIITGLGDVKLNVTSSEATFAGRIQGNNVTFNNIDFSGTNMIYATGKATYNYCTFNRIDASSGKADAFINNCVVLQDVHTEPGMNAGNVYVTESTIAKAEYNASENASIFSFTDCEIGELIIWGDAGTTELNNCTIDLAKINKMNAGTILVIDGVCQVASDDELANAIKSGDDVTVNMPAGNYDMPDGSDVSLQGKTLTITGTKDTVIDATSINENDQFVTGATLVFDGVTVNFGSSFYMGFANTANLIYRNCTINGLQFLYGGNVEFENCVFNSNGAEHSVWTYGADKVSFKDCEFTYADRAINVYGVGRSTVTVSFDNCEFISTSDTSKGAVEINSSAFLGGANVSFVNNCIAPANGTMVGISGYDDTNGATAIVTVNGADFTPVKWAK